MDGLRQCLAEEFGSIHVLNLRGDIRKNMLSKGRAREGQNIFGSGSMTGIAITLFVKNPDALDHGAVYYHDIGNDLSTVDKLASVARFGSIEGISTTNVWRKIAPDEYGDWLGQRDKSFSAFIAIGDKVSSGPKIFDNFSLGVVTNRDAWAYNSSRAVLAANMRTMIAFYNAELNRFNVAHPKADRKFRVGAVESFIEADPQKISWTRSLKGDFVKNKHFVFDEACLSRSLYRPFTRQWLYFNRTFNEMVYQMPRIFPDHDAKNRIVMCTATGSRNGFSCMMSDSLTDLNSMEAGAQCFPRYLYDGDSATADDGQQDLLAADAASGVESQRRDAITDEGLAHFRAAYPDETITKDELFHYVYGLLHSEDYRARYADNLSKELPRIPAVKKVADFWAFVEAGRKLGDLHCGYEQVEPYPVTIAQGDLRLANISDPESFYRVEQMKYAGKRPNLDKTTVIYNANITMTGIPLEAYDYVVNGKPALDWVMERQCVKTDKASGIINDANRFAVETVGDPTYPLKLFQRVVTISLETMKIVRRLPPLGDLS
jgi:predicted helicase